MGLPGIASGHWATAVSRLITRACGAAASNTSSASPHGQAASRGSGIGPLAASASRTHSRASPMVDRVLTEPEWDRLTEHDLRGLTPLFWSNVALHGTFQ